MAHAPEEEVVFDAGVAVERRRRPLAVLRGLADWSVAALFFAVVSFAALPMGANRDWAWAPIAVILGALAVLVACGVGTSKGFEVSQAERKPLLALVACFALFVLFGLFQMSTMAPASATAWLYEAAARLLGSAHAPVPDLAIDAARNTLLKCLSCGAIFLMARALCRDRDRARLLLVMFVAGAILVVAYGVLMRPPTQGRPALRLRRGRRGRHRRLADRLSRDHAGGLPAVAGRPLVLGVARRPCRHPGQRRRARRHDAARPLALAAGPGAHLRGDQRRGRHRRAGDRGQHHRRQGDPRQRRRRSHADLAGLAECRSDVA